MKGFRNIAEKMIQMRRGKQPSQSPVAPEMGRGLLRNGGGFSGMMKSMMQKRQMQDKPNMTISGPNAMPGTMKKGGTVKMARGGGCEIRGKTRGKFV